MNVNTLISSFFLFLLVNTAVYAKDEVGVPDGAGAAIDTIISAVDNISYTVLYTAKDNYTYFKSASKPMYAAKIGEISHPIHADVFSFAKADPGVQTWQNVPHRMFIILLSGEIQVHASSGQVRIFKAGDIFLAKDIHGKGHLIRVLNDKPVYYATLTF